MDEGLIKAYHCKVLEANYNIRNAFAQMHCKDTTVELDVYPEEPEVLVMTCVVGFQHDIGKLSESRYCGPNKFLKKYFHNLFTK